MKGENNATKGNVEYKAVLLRYDIRPHSDRRRGRERYRGASQDATISGAVADSSGAILVGAKIEVKNLGTGITQSVITDAQGRYSAPDLPVGDYEVRASATGFQTVVRTGITLTVGSQPAADFTLPKGSDRRYPARPSG
jgi:hypothetical protein